MYNTLGLSINAGVPAVGVVVAAETGWWLPVAIAVLLVGVLGLLIAARAHLHGAREFGSH